MEATMSPFRDLNKNGRLDPYEDPARPIDERVEDLLAQMTLEEKAGLMFHQIAGVNPNGTLDPPAHGPFRQPIAESVTGKLINHYNVHGLPEPRLAARWHNNLQQLAEATRLGIPVTISSDPRHGFQSNPLTSFAAASFSQWPEPIGMGAIGDPQLVEQFGDIARQEYVALGIRVALHPMADLATEPRWARINGTFGENAAMAASLTAAYIRGFQGTELGPHSVACMTKHFPGGGPQKDGEDPHFAYGREQVYPAGLFDYHLPPFEAAFAAGTAQIMPYYGMPIGTELEEVGFAFNKQVITDLLRGRYGFDGVVCADWGVITDKAGPATMVARAWGVEHLTPLERLKKALDAGVDQFGGEACPELVVELVQRGQVSEARIDESARRLLRDKFRLGLFDNPYLDEEAAERIVGRADFRTAGETAQRRAIVLLKNGAHGGKPALPLADRPRIYVEGIDPQTAAQYGEVTGIDEAELAIVRLSTPYEQRNGEFLEQLFHAGDLDFKSPEKERIIALLARIPTVVAIHLDRPAVIPEIAEHALALLGEFGASDAAVLDVVWGRFAPEGKLPFELPSSMEAVRAQHPDAPHDSANPLFPFGHGLTYE
jgi:beta-glucosidase